MEKLISQKEVERTLSQKELEILRKHRKEEEQREFDVRTRKMNAYARVLQEIKTLVMECEEKIKGIVQVWPDE